MLRIAMLVLALCLPLDAAAGTVEVAPGVHVLPGIPGDPEPANLGRTGNCGFIVGTTGVVVVDTGVSRAHGEALLAEIRRVTSLPVVLVINTHAVQEFLFGDSAFDPAALLAHRATVELMRSRCEHCLENLRQMLGDSAMQGTSLVVPERTVDGDALIDAGGRRLRLVHPGWAATPGDLLVLDEATATLFTGSVATQDQVPLLRDGRLADWMTALDAIEALAPRTVVPGHGPVPAPRAVRATRDYLVELDRVVRRLYDGGASLIEAIDRAELPGFAHWAGYGSVHRKNVQQLYLELEIEELQR
jgi:glyoxylase-like metal-dependent hydrolase (beta-lactamase superfamily II)